MIGHHFHLNLMADVTDNMCTTDHQATPCTASIAKHFPGAIRNDDFIALLQDKLAPHGYRADNTLVATSLCADEVNRELETDLAAAFGGKTFHLGGLAGLPLTGHVGFGAFSRHVPDNGHILLVVGPHVGVNAQGVVGTVERAGRAQGGACCGSAQAALGYVQEVLLGTTQEQSIDNVHPLDAQQAIVGATLLKYSHRLAVTDMPMVEVPLVLAEAANKWISQVIQQANSFAGNMAVVVGVQINTSGRDYFLPMRFSLLDGQGSLMQNLLHEDATTEAAAEAA